MTTERPRGLTERGERSRTAAASSRGRVAVASASMAASPIVSRSEHKCARRTAARSTSAMPRIIDMPANRRLLAFGANAGIRTGRMTFDRGDQTAVASTMRSGPEVAVTVPSLNPAPALAACAVAQAHAAAPLHGGAHARLVPRARPGRQRRPRLPGRARARARARRAVVRPQGRRRRPHAGDERELLCAIGMDREGEVDLARLELGAREDVVLRV